MDDGTRAASAPSEPAEAFATFVTDWLERSGPLIDALVVLRLPSGQRDGIEALLEVGTVRSMRESWELWELFAGMGSEQLAARLEPFLGTDLVDMLRFALWGTEPGIEGD